METSLTGDGQGAGLDCYSPPSLILGKVRSVAHRPSLVNEIGETIETVEVVPIDVGEGGGPAVWTYGASDDESG